MCRGLATTVCRDSISFAAYFGVYEWVCQRFGKSGTVALYGGLNKHLLLNAKPKPNTVETFSGGLAGMAAWAVIYPIDVVKTRWQTAPTNTYNSLVDCLRQSVHREGYRFMVKGMGATLARAAPQHAVTFYTYELIGKYLRTA
jgi:solute carrier family 25 carnitine/acylcarnitine transporter 20/29